MDETFYTHDSFSLEPEIKKDLHIFFIPVYALNKYLKFFSFLNLYLHHI